MSYKINAANIKDWTDAYSGELFDGVLCDPPYELGFMGKSWDSSGIAYDVEMWRGIFKLLKPGAHLLAFSGSRTYHRMAVAIEDAGFEIRDMIEWVYGSGFPKSLNIGKAVDKIQGNEREVVGPNPANRPYNYEKGETSTGWQSPPRPDKDKGTSEWEGYGTALKPAHEPCVLARKPLDGTVANNALKHGTGGLNIDGSRVEIDDNDNSGWSGSQAVPPGGSATNAFGVHKFDKVDRNKPTGRFPANLIHDGSDEVEAVFPQNIKPSFRKGDRASNNDGIVPWNRGRESGRSVTGAGFTDGGSASRFFMTCKDTQKHAIMSVWNDIHASIAENNSTITALIEKVMNITSALESVPLNIDLVNRSLNALFVGEKSKSTEIDFVAKLVAIKEVPEDLVSQEELKAIQGYIGSSENSIQTQSRVSTAESKGNTDITQIIINCMKLCGYVLHATDENTKQASQESDSDQAKTTRFLYTAKASKSERNAGLDGFEKKQSSGGGGLTSPTGEDGHILVSGEKGTAGKYGSAKAAAQNHHPTVKPLTLTKYLATLIKPPKGGRLLVPFSGSGSEMIGALQAGWEYVEGVELTQEYIPIAEARIRYWLDLIAEENKQLTII